MSVNGVIISLSADEIAWLRAAAEDEIDEKMDAWFDEPRACHLEKHYAATSYLLSGEPHGGDGLAGFIGNDDLGEALDYEFPYGPGRLFDIDETRAVDAAVRDVAANVVESRLGDAALAEIYPFSLGGLDDDDRAALREDLQRVRDHVRQAAESGRGLLVAVF